MRIITASLILLLGSSLAIAQEMTVSGRVTTASGEGIPGVVVSEDNATASTTTDATGTYQLSVTNSYGYLVFNHPEYGRQRIFINGQTSLNATLSPGLQRSDEISTGFGTQSRSEITSSIAQISNEQLQNQPVVGLEQSSQGRAAGVLVQNSGGNLGQASRVRIRGGSSLSGSNEPLYVVDGVPLTSGNQSDIDPSSVESMEILKDASATAMYGSRAANGVVLITTKKGTQGRLKVDAEYQLGVSSAPKKLDMMSPSEYNQMFIEYTLRQPILGSLVPSTDITQQNLDQWTQEAMQLYQTHPDSTYQIQLSNGNSVGIPLLTRLNNDTDWQDLAFRTALSHRANVSLSAGSEKHQVYANLNYLTQDGILIGNDYERFGGRLNISSDLSSRLSSDLSFSYIRTNNNRLNEDADVGNPVQMVLLPPSDRPVPENDYVLDIRSSEYNPQTEVYNSLNFETADRINGNLSLNYLINETLSLNVDGGVDYVDSRDERRQGPPTQEGQLTGLSRLGTTNLFNYLANGYLSYEKNALSVIAGASYQNSQGSFTFRRARINSIGQLESLREGDPSLLNNPLPGSAFSLLSFYTRANYSINGKYLFQVSGRVDGSTKFSEQNRYGFFPAASAGWNISDEAFLNGVDVISLLKLKASYGVVGNTPEDDFLYRRNYFTVMYGNSDGLRLQNLANQNLKWESTGQLDVGLDFGFIQDRISGSLNYYQKNTTDLLFPVPVSQTSGFTNVIKNTGSMVNSGLELAINSVNISTEDFEWTTFFNISTNKSEIKDLGGQRLISGVNAFIEGEPVGAFYMVKYEGVAPLTGEPLYDNGNGLPTTDYDYALENGRQVLGNPNPKYFGGLSNTVSYKSLELNFTFQFVQGIDLYWETGELIANSGFGLYNQTADQAGRWYQPGDDTNIPVLNPVLENTNPSSRWLVDGSYIRLNNVTLSYNLPAEVLSSMGLRRLSVYVGGQNLLTISDYPGYDPDVSYSDPDGGVFAQNINRGIDLFTSPQPRIFTSGIKIGF